MISFDDLAALPHVIRQYGRGRKSPRLIAGVPVHGANFIMLHEIRLRFFFFFFFFFFPVEYLILFGIGHRAHDLAAVDQHRVVIGGEHGVTVFHDSARTNPQCRRSMPHVVIARVRKHAHARIAERVEIPSFGVDNGQQLWSHGQRRAGTPDEIDECGFFEDEVIPPDAAGLRSPHAPVNADGIGFEGIKSEIDFSPVRRRRNRDVIE